MAKKKKKHRSAITGEYVPESTAKKNPKTTVSETAKPALKKKKKTKKKKT